MKNTEQEWTLRDNANQNHNEILDVIPTRMAIIKKTDKDKYWQGCRKAGIKWCSHFGKQSGSISKHNVITPSYISKKMKTGSHRLKQECSWQHYSQQPEVKTITQMSIN